MSRANILLVGSDLSEGAWERLLEARGQQVVVLDPGTGLTDSLRSDPPDLVIFDGRAPGAAQAALIRDLRELSPRMEILVLEEQGEPCLEGVGALAFARVPRPVPPELLSMLVDRALERRRLFIPAHARRPGSTRS